jgi:hypothetical protein
MLFDPPLKPQVVQWNSGDANAPAPVSGPQASQPAPPPVPSQTGSGGTTVVNTAALETFASNINQLIGPVKDAYSQLQNMTPLQIGQLNESTALEGKINSATSSSATSGLVDSYTAVLNDLANGLTDIYNAVKTMSKNYTTADDLNKMTATDLQNAFQQAQGDFSSMMTANGGTSPGPSSGAASGAGGAGGTAGNGGQSAS